LLILHVVSSAQRRGAEIFLLDLVRALNRHHVSQHVVVLRRGANDIRFDAPTLYLSSKRRLPPLPHLWPRGVRYLKHLISRLGPDVVQVHGGEALKAALLARGRRSTPIVYRRIGMAHPNATYGLRRLLHGRMMRRCCAIVAVAEAVRTEAIEVFGIDPTHVVTIPRGVDPQRLQPTRGRDATRASLRIPTHAPVLLSLGSLTWEKDPLAHIAVAERVAMEIPDTVHLVVGDGPLRVHMQDAVRERGIEPNVRFLGRRDDVADLLAASDLILLASRIEGMPGCIIEAGMAGTPTAAYGVAGVPEIVQHGITGLLATPGDIVELSRHVLQLIRDPMTAKAMGMAAAKAYEAKFTISAIASRYVDVYSDLGAIARPVRVR
jgi:glycosyltransferase involved in cell wall biosynthesis